MADHDDAQDYTANGPTDVGFRTGGDNTGIRKGVDVTGTQIGVLGTSVGTDEDILIVPAGVVGIAHLGGRGVFGKSDEGIGVLGNGKVGVQGIGPDFGVTGTGGDAGVFGRSTRNDSNSTLGGVGVEGHSDGSHPGSAGVHGKGDDSSGVHGSSNRGIGVFGSSGQNAEVFFDSSSGQFAGVLHSHGRNAGLFGRSETGRGGVFESMDLVAQVRLVPAQQFTLTPELPKAGKVGDLLLIRNTAKNPDAPKDAPSERDECTLWLCVPGIPIPGEPPADDSNTKNSPAQWQQVFMSGPHPGTV